MVVSGASAAQEMIRKADWESPLKRRRFLSAVDEDASTNVRGKHSVRYEALAVPERVGT